MDCSSIVSMAPFGPRDPVSKPGWFAVSNSNWVINSWIIQPYNLAIQIVIKVNVSSLVGGDKYQLKL